MDSIPGMAVGLENLLRSVLQIPNEKHNASLDAGMELFMEQWAMSICDWTTRLANQNVLSNLSPVIVPPAVHISCCSQSKREIGTTRYGNDPLVPEASHPAWQRLENIQ